MGLMHVISSTGTIPLDLYFLLPIPLSWSDYGGDAILNTNKHIRLTPDEQSRAGWIWSKTTLPNAAWQIEFEFNIHGGRGHLYGDGMAVWVTKSRVEPGPVFGSRDRFEGLGIFFDTYKNSASTEKYFPIITAMLGDGKTPYDTANDGLTQSIGNCEVSERDGGHPFSFFFCEYTLPYSSFLPSSPPSLVGLLP